MSDMGFTRRDFLKAAGIFTLSMMAPKSAQVAEQKAGSGNYKPNIILLMADGLWRHNGLQPGLEDPNATHGAAGK